VTCSPRAIRVAVHATTAASRTSSAGTSPASRCSGIRIPASVRSSCRRCCPFHVRLEAASGPPASTANETSGCTSRTRRSDVPSISRIAVLSAQACADVAGAMARASAYVAVSSAARGGVKKTLERRGPTTARASRSARRRSPRPGSPIGTSTPTTTASAKRSNSVWKRSSHAESSKRPSRKAIATQPRRATSTPSVSTLVLARHEALMLQLRPDEVGVGSQERDREQRQRRQTALPHRCDCERGAEGRGHRDPGQPRAQTEARGGGEEQREEQQVGESEIRRRRFARDREGDGKGREDVLVVLDDLVRRPARREHGECVDERDDARDEDDPAQLLEVREECEAEEGDGEELAEVLRRLPAGLVTRPRERRKPDGSR